MKQLEHIDIDAALVELTDGDRAHLAACVECKQEFETAGTALGSLRSMGAALERVPESFWQAQQRAIRVGADRKPKRTMTAIYAWAGATAAAALVALSLIPANHTVKTIPTTQKATQTEAMSDAALLESVQDQLEAYPEAIHPAQVMYTEMATAKNTALSVPNKRK